MIWTPKDMANLKKAIVMATQLHNGQVDKIGQPYILHPLAVMLDPELVNPSEKIVAVLHDTLEDTSVSWTLIQAEFGQAIAEAVLILTRHKGMSSTDYYWRVRNSPLALKVKLADIRHNTSPERMNHLDQQTRDRLKEKYRQAMEQLTK